MNHSKGFTLIEVLVAVVIFAIGFVGLAGLQVSALRDVRGAFFGMQATVLAEDMADRLRANQDFALGAFGGNYTTVTATQTPACLAGSTCTRAEAASRDLWEWQQMVATLLPNGVGVVCFDRSSPQDGNNSAPACDGSGAPAVVAGERVATYTIKIFWQEGREKTAAEQTATGQSDLQANEYRFSLNLPL